MRVPSRGSAGPPCRPPRGPGGSAVCAPRPRRVEPRALLLRALLAPRPARGGRLPPRGGDGPGPPVRPSARPPTSGAAERLPRAPRDPSPASRRAAAPLGSSRRLPRPRPRAAGWSSSASAPFRSPSRRSAGAGGQGFCGSHSCLLTREQRQRAACEQWDQSGSLTREWSQGPCMPHVPPPASSSFLSILMETQLYLSISYCILSAIMHEIGFVHDLHFYFFLWPVNQLCCF